MTRTAKALAKWRLPQGVASTVVRVTGQAGAIRWWASLDAKTRGELVRKLHEEASHANQP